MNPSAFEPLDPISELVVDLARDGRPSRAWSARWSRGGRDPVAAAWAEARASYTAMLRVLHLAGRSADWRRATDAVRAEPQVGTFAEHVVACCAVIRRVVPTPPPLPAVLAGVGRTRGGALEGRGET